MDAARQFFSQALAMVDSAPERVTTDGHDSYSRAIRETIGHDVMHRTNTYLNNRLEQDHRGIKQRYYPMRGFGSFTAELGRLSTCDPWVKQIPFLVQLPGVRVLSAMRILATIGQISRFPSAKHLVGYAGLGASVHQSGKTDRGGALPRRRAVICAGYWLRHHRY